MKTTSLIISISVLAGAFLMAGCNGKTERLNTVLWVGGFAHDFDAFAEKMAAALPDHIDVDITVVRDGSFVDDSRADDLDVIVMNHCFESAENVISPSQQARLLDLIRNGTGVVAVHASYYSFVEWDGIRELYGPRFTRHGQTDVMITVETLDSDHPVMKDLPPAFEVRSELYESTPLPGDCHLLARARESTLDIWHPSVWTRTYGEGRVVTILPAHWPDAYDVPAFQQLIAQAILWTAGR